MQKEKEWIITKLSTLSSKGLSEEEESMKKTAESYQGEEGSLFTGMSVAQEQRVSRRRESVWYEM